MDKPLYVEPKGYFTEEMLKILEECEKKAAQKKESKMEYKDFHNLVERMLVEELAKQFKVSEEEAKQYLKSEEKYVSEKYQLTLEHIQQGISPKAVLTESLPHTIVNNLVMSY